MGLTALRRHAAPNDPHSLPAQLSDVTDLVRLGFTRVDQLYGITALDLQRRAREAGVFMTNETITRLVAAITNHKLGIRYGG